VVEDFTSYSRFGFLIFDEPVFQSSSEAGFHTEHGRSRRAGGGGRRCVVSKSLRPYLRMSPRLTNASLYFARFQILNAVRASILMVFLVGEWFLMVSTNLTTPQYESLPRLFRGFLNNWATMPNESVIYEFKSPPWKTQQRSV
jgi:hypothetical protein